jgi:hypothetical protein
MSTSRPVETAFERVIDFIERHAPDLPVIFVGTKKDKFLKSDADLTTKEVNALETGQASQEHRDEDALRDSRRKASWKKQLDKACPNATTILGIEWIFVSRGKCCALKGFLGS